MSKRKKKNAVTLISLLLALAVLIGFYFWYSNKDNSSNKKETENTSSSDEITVAKIDANNLSSLYFKNVKAEMTLVLEGKEWKLKEDPNRPINQDNVKSMVSLIGSIKAAKEVEKKADMSEYGLSEPSIMVEAKEKDGKTLTLDIGDEAATGDGYYAKVNGEDKVFLLASNYYNNFSFNYDDMTSVKAAPTIAANTIKHLIIDQKNGKDFELLFKAGNKLDFSKTGMFSYMILKPYKEGYTADGTSVTNLLNNYTNLNFISCVDYNSSDMRKYGLDDPQASVYIGFIEQHTKKLAKPEIDPATGKKVNEKTVNKDKSVKIFIGNLDDSGNNNYVRMDGSNAVYTMNTDQVKTLLNVDAFSMVNKFVILPFIDNINSIDITIDGKPYTMEIKRGTEKDKNGKPKATYYYNGNIVKEKVFKTVYQTIVSATYDAESKKKIQTDGKEPFMTITYHPISGQDISASFLPYDDSFYSVKQGKNVRFFADKRKIDAIAKAVKEFKADLN